MNEFKSTGYCGVLRRNRKLQKPVMFDRVPNQSVHVRGKLQFTDVHFQSQLVNRGCTQNQSCIGAP